VSPGSASDSSAGSRHLRCTDVQRVEFTIEPFVEGQPGPHVTEPIACIEARGHHVDFGPFGSEFTTPSSETPEIVAEILRAAFANGATHVTIDVAAADATTEMPRPDVAR
jgi:uncharacterized protein YqgV (UPF0045/DUF77 family)